MAGAVAMKMNRFMVLAGLVGLDGLAQYAGPRGPAGEIVTLRFAIWGSGDAVLDSAALVDNFVWSVKEPKVETTPIVF